MHRLRIEVVGEDGGYSVRDLGEVRIDEGGFAVLRERVWGSDSEERWEEEFDPTGPILTDAEGAQAS
jgi:hypothetical protein